MSTRATTTPAARSPVRTARRSRAAVVAGAGVVALAVWVLSVPILGAEVTADAGGTVAEIGAVSVVTSSVLAGLAAWALLAALERWTTHARRTWTVVAVTVLLVSLLGPVARADSGLAVLLLEHLAVGAVLVAGLRPSPPVPSPRTR